MTATQMHQVTYKSPLGDFTIIGDSEAIAELLFPGQKPVGAASASPQNSVNAGQNTGHAVDGLPQILRQAIAWLDEYFSGREPSVACINLRPAGNAFRQCVWKQVSAIPYGKTSTYSEIAAMVAKDMGKPRMSAQAVGQAIGSNPIPLLIPCHRVIGKDGSLTGYAGGLELKKRLLEHEKCAAQGLD